MYYFAYASNLNRKQMSERCPDSKPLFRATLPHYKLIFTGHSRKWRGATASIKPFQDSKVNGAVYEISPACLRSLDKHEGYPDVYSRINIRVKTGDDEWVEAVAYIGREQSERGQPSREYLAVIQQGYKDWRIIV
ncbi:gamma-glutamylcyclotransferase family protein [Chloroflexota bacterium]